MYNKELNIFGRDFNLSCRYDCFEKEEILENQKKTFETFNSDIIEKSKDEVFKYCIAKSGGDITQIDNIFKYLIPESIYITRSENPEIAILCSYKFDIEHGIAIVFQNNKLKEIGAQDIIL